MGVSGIVISFILHAISFAAAVRATIIFHGADFDPEGASSMDNLKLTLLSLTYVVANVAMIVTVRDLFHIGTKLTEWDCIGAKYLIWIVKPFTVFVFALLGVRKTASSYYQDTTDDVDEIVTLANMKDIIDISTSRIRAD